MPVAAIGYLRIAAQDANAWMDFGTNVLGLMDAQREDAQGARFLRMDDQPFRFMVEASDTDVLLAAGLEYRSQADLEEVSAGLTAAGHNVEAGSAEQAQRRCVSDFVTVTDPSGNTLELYWGRKLDYLPFVSPVAVNGFVTGDGDTGDMGFGHAVLPAPETAATISFYTDLIGFGICDTLHIPMPESQVIFMHADNPRQHSLALYNQPYPVGVVHLMVEVETLDEVGLAMDRAIAAGAHIITSLGRHVNDNMFSFYVLAPNGMAVEYGFDGLLIDWDNYTPTISTEGDLWGHEYNFPGVND
jgi:3,4-dihydroxy-9,10-secoandrosta-1,3,5(10)-triene-9,17-dione 4,5-dioxygenase